MNFITYLDEIEKLKKERRYDGAWALANKALIDLEMQKEEMWFMMYYQMADILAREKRWFEALEKMGFVIHYLGHLGGITHEKFVKRLLKKFELEGKIEEYLDIVKLSKPRQLGKKLKNLINA